MNNIDVFEVSRTEFSVLVPLINRKKDVDRLKIDIEAYLIILGYNNFSCKWDDIKFIGKLFTKFTLEFPEEKTPSKKIVESVFYSLTKGKECNDVFQNLF